MTKKNGAKMAPKQRRKELVIDLTEAKGRLSKAEARLKELETGQPTAFVEIRQAKNIVSAAKAIVQLYQGRVDELDKASGCSNAPSAQGGKVGV